MIGLLGKKIRMTQVFDDDGRPVPVTVVEAGPCVVTAIREEYGALQLGFETVKEERLNRPQRGVFQKHDLPMLKHLREFRPEAGTEGYERGQSITVDVFAVGDHVDVVGRTKGRGFQGVVKRWGFAGYSNTHGTKDKHRVPGSIGQATFPGRVWKNKKLPGHYGHDRRTVRNLRVIRVEPEKNLIFLRGAVPGSRGSLVAIRARKKTGE